ncbi:MAG: prepilin-type N-terminal cleavage/methylation domain-containing protein [Candidatus Calescibacterium sp.]|nr:prepilin-type N-terminal cleavage/methylation domain-containing protein [Candidatus Calescibacterium sp.]MDW8132968.1 prepilin-type N-terminal cleavage/methylation domain-containing protein [Candidatus Calescibacterium sp.]
MKRTQRGLSLIELLTVVAIIGILATILLPYTLNRLEDSKIAKMEQEISSLMSATALFYNDNSTIPNIWNDFVTPPTGFTNWRGPYINKAPNPGSTALWTAASVWKTDYRIHRLVGATTDHRFGSITNLYPLRNALALEITNPLAGTSPIIPLTSLQRIDTDIDNNNAGSGFIIEANANTTPFITGGSMGGLTTTAAYAGGGKSVYVLLFTYY